MNKTASKDPQVYAVVVNWNNPTDTVACINSILAQQGLTPRVIVVDNGSTDDSVSIIREKFHQVDMITSPVNLKYARGYNLGIRRAVECGADVVFIINNDAVISSNSLALMLRYIGTGVGIVAPLIYYSDRPERIWSIGGRIRPWTLESSADFRNVVDPGEWPPVLERDFATGCCMLLGRQAIEEVGLFDENFVHYYEDMDLCRRMRLAGYRILVVPQAKAWHKVALSSGGSDSPDERYWMARSSVRYFWKYGRGVRMLAVVPYRLGSAIKTSIRLLLRFRGDALLAYWRGIRDGIKVRSVPDNEISGNRVS